MQSSIATACLSGGLVEKLQASAAAGFDGVEIMDADLVASFHSPEDIRKLCEDLGLKINMFQPLRDIEAVDEASFARNLRRARAKFDLMERLGTDLLLLCSNVSTASINDADVVAEQLGILADQAADRGIRIAYEALAWSKYVKDYREAWQLVQRANRENLGICLDSFHIFSQRLDLAGISQIDSDKLFFLQLADAPELQLDPLSWSRHHRLFPGEGDFELVDFLQRVVNAGYKGPLSLEVFNDTYRQTDTFGTAKHAMRSLNWIVQSADLAGNDLSSVRRPQLVAAGIDFVKVTGGGVSRLEHHLHHLGFSKFGVPGDPSNRQWRAGGACIIVEDHQDEAVTRLSGVGLYVNETDSVALQSHIVDASNIGSTIQQAPQSSASALSPDGTMIYWNVAWDTRGSDADIQAIGHAAEDVDGLAHFTFDHLNISTSWQHFDETVLFNRSILGLEKEKLSELPGPRGFIRSQVMRNPNGSVRVAMNLAPPTAALPPRHIALRTADAVGAAKKAQARGMSFLPIPDNYYDDLAARFALEPEFLETMRDLHLLYDQNETGEYIHFYTPIVDEVFFEVVQRIGNYEEYGAMNAPVRMTAQPAHSE